MNHMVSPSKDVLEKHLNSLLSGRYLVFEKGVELIEDAVQKKDYFSLFFGFGINPPRYFPNLSKDQFVPYFFESVFFLCEYIARGVLGLFGILLLFFNSFRWITIWFKRKDEEREYLLAFWVPMVYQAGYTLFNVFWHVDLPLFLLFFGLAESRLKGRLNPPSEKGA
jgi:hypothetical protein